MPLVINCSQKCRSIKKYSYYVKVDLINSKLNKVACCDEANREMMNNNNNIL